MKVITNNSQFNPNRLKSYALLHLSFLIYASGTVMMKLAAGHTALSFSFLMFYAFGMIALGVYAILWQQVLKGLPLTIAFSSKAITILWGMLTGYVFFKETISPKMIIGAVIIITGIVLVANGESDA